jgi:inner membrane protein
MMAGAHVALGAAAWLAAAPRLGLPAMDPVSLGLAVAGSLLPDIDHPHSWVGRRVWPLSTIIAAVLGHRGATHSLLAVVGCGWLLFHDGTPRALVAPVLVGYLSHLVGDLLTPRGLRLAWPLKGTWALPLCRTGSPFEPVVVTALLLAAWFSAATPETRQGLVAATRICVWIGPDRLPSLCPPPRRPHAEPRRRKAVVASIRPGPRV